MGNVNTEEELIQSILHRFPFFGETSLQNWKFSKRIRDPHHQDRYTLVFKQYKDGVPTFSGEIKVHFVQLTRVIPAILSMDCYIIPKLHELNMDEVITPEIASEIAQDWAEFEGESEITIPKIQKVIYRFNSVNYLVWWLQVFSVNSQEFKRNLFIDIITGDVISQFSIIKYALNREAWYGYYKSTSVPYWKEGNSFPTNNSEANNMITFSGYTYNMMFNAFQIRSYDQNDAKMISVFDLADSPSQPGCKSANAFWDSVSVNFCEGLTKIDVVGHEWGHAYNQYSADLIYQSQSGALNEAFADIVGESVQFYFGTVYPTRNETCGSGNRWIIGEDVKIPGITGGIRDMYNPNCFNNPRAIDDINYIQCGTIDYGGVHTNSGILNQAFAISVDGINSAYFGSLTGLGLTKSFHIYLRTLLVKLGSGATFASTATSLMSSCDDLVGVNLKDPKTGNPSNITITTGDCDNLQSIIDATHLSDSYCGTSSSTPTYPVITGYFPPIGYAGIEPATKIFYVAQSSFSANIDDTTCKFYDSENTLLGTSTALFYTYEYSFLIACATPVRNTVGEQLSVAISWDGVTIDPSSIATFTYTVPLEISSISPSKIDGSSEVTITITGSGFEEYSECFGAIDVNGDSYDCLSCIFGDISYSAPVEAKLVDSNHVSCNIPPRWKLIDQSQSLAVWVSKNSQIFFTNPNLFITFSSDGTSGGSSVSSGQSSGSSSSNDGNSSSSDSSRISTVFSFLILALFAMLQL